MYYVLFNSSNRDPIIMTNDHGFVESFGSHEDATKEADEWIDGKDYRDYIILEQ
jgi:hypothetical protein